MKLRPRLFSCSLNDETDIFISESQIQVWDWDIFSQVSRSRLRPRLPLVSKSRLRPKIFKDSYGHGPLESFLVSYGASSVFKRYCNVPTLQWLQLKRVPLLKMSLYEIATYCSPPVFADSIYPPTPKPEQKFAIQSWQVYIFNHIMPRWTIWKILAKPYKHITPNIIKVFPIQ